MRQTSVSVPEPTTFHRIDDEHVEMRCFGKTTGDWTPSRPHDPTAMRIAAVLDAYDCGRTVMPNPSMFNAAIVHSADHNEWHAPWGGGRILRGPYADGVVFTSANGPQTFAIASADCPTVLLVSRTNGPRIVLHAGRDSLIDRQAATSGNPSRRHFSVIDAAMEIMAAYGVEPEEITAFSRCGIAARHFSHDPADPRYGETNRLMLSFVRRRFGDRAADPERGMLDLHALIRLQLLVYGVPEDAIRSDDVDTYDDRNADGSPRWASQRRDRAGRNLVLVTMR